MVIPRFSKGIIRGSQSQLSQDKFVHAVCGEGCRYLEIGANHPVKLSNTYELEARGWEGTSIDISPQFLDHWLSTRTQPLIISDAADLDYSAFGEVDYLQVDCEPAAISLNILRLAVSNLPRLPAVITFEHELYQEGSEAKDAAREFLEAHGYELIVENVGLDGMVAGFEDWYVYKNDNAERLHNARKFTNLGTQLTPVSWVNERYAAGFIV